MRKPLFLTALYAAFVLGGYAQTSDVEAEAIINLLGVQKKEAIARLLLRHLNSTRLKFIC